MADAQVQLLEGISLLGNRGKFTEWQLLKCRCNSFSLEEAQHAAYLMRKQPDGFSGRSHSQEGVQP